MGGWVGGGAGGCFAARVGPDTLKRAPRVACVAVLIARTKLLGPLMTAEEPHVPSPPPPFVQGAVMRLLAESYTSRDFVSLIPFYGDKVSRQGPRRRRRGSALGRAGPATAQQGHKH